jgi:hypothetical protein
MADMTILHIASPFAFSSPVNESRSSTPPGGGEDGQQRDTGDTKTDAGSTRTASARDTGIDARDARLTLSRTVDLAGPVPGAAATGQTLSSVLAAYTEENLSDQGGSSDGS